jgi:hypothetical protein
MDLGQLVDADFQRPHRLGAKPIRTDRAYHPVLGVVHVDQGAQPHAGVELLLREIVGFGGGQQRPRLVDEKIVRPLDLHDVGAFGDRPKGPVGRAVNQRHRRVCAKMGKCCMQPRLVRIGCRIGEYLRSLVNDWCAHRPSHPFARPFDRCQL